MSVMNLTSNLAAARVGAGALAAAGVRGRNKPAKANRTAGSFANVRMEFMIVQGLCVPGQAGCGVRTWCAAAVYRASFVSGRLTAYLPWQSAIGRGIAHGLPCYPEMGINRFSPASVPGSRNRTAKNHRSPEVRSPPILEESKILLPYSLHPRSQRIQLLVDMLVPAVDVI